PADASPSPAPAGGTAAADRTAPATAGGAAANGAEEAAERTPVLVGYGPRTTAVRRRPRKAAPPPAPARHPEPARAGQVLDAPRRPVGSASDLRILAKPPVRKLARDLGVDLRTLTGTGPAGSITRQDVEAAVAA